MIGANNGADVMGRGPEMYQMGFQLGQQKSPVAGIGDMIRQVMARAQKVDDTYVAGGLDLAKTKMTLDATHPFHPLPEGKQNIITQSFVDPGTKKSMTASGVWDTSKGDYTWNHPSVVTPVSGQQELIDLSLAPALEAARQKNAIEQSASSQPAAAGISKAVAPSAQGQSKVITAAIAQQFIAQAGGDRAAGRELARAAGYKI